MDKVLNIILATPINYLMIILVILFYSFEQVLETPFKFNKRSDHFFNNFLFQIVIIVVTFFLATVQIFSMELINTNNWGLLNQFDVLPIGKIIIGVLAFDFVNYWAHRLSHKPPALWKLHRVHHSDTTMDTSTYFRHSINDSATF